MTKANLIKLLEPYRDDQEIAVNSDLPYLFQRNISSSEKFLIPYNKKGIGNFFVDPNNLPDFEGLPVNVVTLT